MGSDRRSPWPARRSCSWRAGARRTRRASTARTTPCSRTRPGRSSRRRRPRRPRPRRPRLVPPGTTAPGCRRARPRRAPSSTLRGGWCAAPRRPPAPLSRRPGSALASQRRQRPVGLIPSPVAVSPAGPEGRPRTSCRASPVSVAALPPDSRRRTLRPQSRNSERSHRPLTASSQHPERRSKCPVDRPGRVPGPGEGSEGCAEVHRH